MAGTIFSELLVQFRKDAGFKTAYSFFHGNGGQAVMGLSYRKYTMLESGRNLPVLQRLGTLSYALRLVPQSPKANALTLAWLRTFAGPDTYRDVLEAVISPQAEAKGVSPLHKAVEKSMADKKYFMTPEQYAAALTSFETYLCYQGMTNETGSWTVPALAKALEMDAKKAAAAIKILAAAKIVKETRKGVYKCPFSGYTIDTPQLNINRDELREKVRRYHQQLKATGVNEWTSRCTLRADSVVFRGYLPMMNLMIHTAATYATLQKTENTALYLVESLITRLRKF